jgi:hypothetical protein
MRLCPSTRLCHLPTRVAQLNTDPTLAGCSAVVDETDADDARDMAATGGRCAVPGRSLSEEVNPACCAESHIAGSPSLEHTMTNHPIEHTRADGRIEDKDKRANGDPDTGPEPPETEAAAPILQSEDDELVDEDAPE